VLNFKKLFYYNNGHLYWKIKISDKINTGQLAGSKSGKYSQISINKQKFYVHRIVFYLFHGYFPKYVDHINRNTRDNRIENLRSVTISLNNRNTGKRKQNATSKYVGVIYEKRRNKWRAACSVNNKSIFIGYFKTEKQAKRAYNMYIKELK